MFPRETRYKPPAPYGAYLSLSVSAPLAGQAGERRGVGGRHPVLAEHDHHAFHIELKAGEQVLQRQFAALVRDVVLFDIGQHNAPPILPGDDSHVVAPPILPHTGQVAFHRVIADIRHILAVDDRHAHRARVVIRHQLQLGLKLLVQHEQAADSLLTGVFRQLLCPCPGSSRRMRAASAVLSIRRTRLLALSAET